MRAVIRDAIGEQLLGPLVALLDLRSPAGANGSSSSSSSSPPMLEPLQDRLERRIDARRALTFMSKTPLRIASTSSRSNATSTHEMVAGSFEMTARWPCRDASATDASSRRRSPSRRSRGRGGDTSACAARAVRGCRQRPDRRVRREPVLDGLPVERLVAVPVVLGRGDDRDDRKARRLEDHDRALERRPRVATILVVLRQRKAPPVRLADDDVAAGTDGRRERIDGRRRGSPKTKLAPRQSAAS